MMTRGALFSTLLSAPLAALAGKQAPARDYSMVIAPSRITIAPGGGIHIPDAGGVRIEGCHFEGGDIQTSHA